MTNHKHGPDGRLVRLFDQPKRRVNICLTLTALTHLDSLGQRFGAGSRGELLEWLGREQLSLSRHSRGEPQQSFESRHLLSLAAEHSPSQKQ